MSVRTFSFGGLCLSCSSFVHFCFVLSSPDCLAIRRLVGWNINDINLILFCACFSSFYASFAIATATAIAVATTAAHTMKSRRCGATRTTILAYIW